MLHVAVCVYVRAHMCVRMYVCVCMCAHVCVHVCVRVCVYTCNFFLNRRLIEIAEGNPAKFRLNYGELETRKQFIRDTRSVVKVCSLVKCTYIIYIHVYIACVRVPHSDKWCSFVNVLYDSLYDNASVVVTYHQFPHPLSENKGLHE